MKPQPVLNHRTPQSLDVSIQRACRHDGCGREMLIGGKDFVRLSDPFVAVAGTFNCTSCSKTDWLASFRWVDTGEDVVAYRSRVRKAAPAVLKIWSAVKRIIIIFFDLLGFLIGLGIGAVVNENGISIFLGAAIGCTLAVGFGPLLLWPIDRVLRADFRLYR